MGNTLPRAVENGTKQQQTRPGERAQRVRADYELLVELLVGYRVRDVRGTGTVPFFAQSVLRNLGLQLP